MAKPKFAFQCVNCGALESAAAAGENAVPRSCHVCGHGDRNPSNWIILANLSPKELAEVTHLTADDVEVHFIEDVEPPQGQSITRDIREGIGSNEAT